MTRVNELGPLSIFLLFSQSSLKSRFLSAFSVLSSILIGDLGFNKCL